MSLPAMPIGDNPFQPGATAETYIPDQLIAGDLKLVTEGQATLAGGQGVLKRGSPLGQLASKKFTTFNPAGADGSQLVTAILADDVDTTSGDEVGGVYLTGEFNANALQLANGATADQVKTAARPFGIFIKSCVSAADPA